mmetsp:Transcript_4394/g.15759  ORF Transcript_4394/g.15759 Transcript_4394/m.15759 type:complete len:272 (-) Transcript_4394:164-979(-)
MAPRSNHLAGGGERRREGLLLARNGRLVLLQGHVAVVRQRVAWVLRLLRPLRRWWRWCTLAASPSTPEGDGLAAVVEGVALYLGGGEPWVAGWRFDVDGTMRSVVVLVHGGGRVGAVLVGLRQVLMGWRVGARARRDVARMSQVLVLRRVRAAVLPRRGWRRALLLEHEQLVLLLLCLGALEPRALAVGAIRVDLPKGVEKILNRGRALHNHTPRSVWAGAGTSRAACVKGPAEEYSAACCWLTAAAPQPRYQVAAASTRPLRGRGRVEAT